MTQAERKQLQAIIERLQTTADNIPGASVARYSKGRVATVASRDLERILADLRELAGEAETVGDE